MKKYLIIVSSSLLILISILILNSKINNYLKNKNIKIIKSSIVTITKKENLELIEEKYGLQTKKIKNIKKDKLIGKGFFINNNGYILTNRHIVNSYSGTYQVNYNNKIYLAKVIKILKDKDISLIKINVNNNYFLKIENNPNIYIGKKVLFLKNNLFISGVILEKNISLGKNNNDIINTNLVLKPGDSGTPLFNNSYKVIGVNTAISNRNNTYSTLINKQILK